MTAEFTPPIPDGAVDRLAAELAERAGDEGLLDVEYRFVDSPWGPLLVARTSRGVVRVAFEREGHDSVLQQLADTLGPRVLRSGRGLDAAARQFDEYFGGRRRAFDVPVDLRLSRGFRREVLDHLPLIPFGTTESYGQVAAALGRPRAVRAAGTACATNPLPLVLPCHRVVRSDGGTGSYLGGAEAKRALLAWEGAARLGGDETRLT